MTRAECEPCGSCPRCATRVELHEAARAASGALSDELGAVSPEEIENDPTLEAHKRIKDRLNRALEATKGDIGL